MEPIFEIQYVESLEFLKKIYCRYMRPRKVIMLPVYGICTIFFLIAGISEQVTLLTVYGAVCVLFALWEFISPFRLAGRAYKKKLSYYNNENPLLTVRFGDAMEVSDIDSYARYPYDKIKKISLMDRIIIFYFQDGKRFAFPAENFTVGTYPEFLNYLREKCPQVKLPDWKW